MQKRTKFLPLLLALAMLLAFAMPAMAAHALMAENGTGTITISAPEHHNLASAETYTLYQLYDLVNITGSTAPYQFVYKPNATVVNFLNWVEAGASGWNSSMVYAKPTLPGYGVTTLPSVDAAAAAEEFRQWLQTFDNAGDNDYDDDVFDAQKIIELATMMVLSGLQPKVVSPTINPDGMPNALRFENLDFAYYLVVGQGVHETNPDGSKSVTRGILVNVPEYEDPTKTTGNVTKHAKRDLKIDVPTVDKEVQDHDDSWGDETDKNIGDTIDYKITSAVPDTAGYLGYSFIMSDILSKGLSFVGAPAPGYLDVAANSVKITIGGVDYTSFTARLLAASDINATNLGKLDGVYNFAGDPYMLDGGHLLIIDFTPTDAAMKAFMAKAAGAEIVVTYQAILNENAIIGSAGNPNKVILFYNTNPTASPCVLGKTPEDETIVYTFDIDILKVDGEDESETLEGAEFELKNSKGEVLKFKLAGGVYRLAITGGDTKLVSGDDGTIKLEGLDAGIYSLKETKAPVGYNPLKNEIEIVIVHEHIDGVGTGNHTVSYTADGVTATGVVTIGNFTGGVLPGTGGIGTYIFFGVGGGLAVLLIVAFIIYKRKRTLGSLIA